jgi:hypothetical protein
VKKTYVFENFMQKRLLGKAQLVGAEAWCWR